MPWLSTAKWVGTGAGVSGALMIGFKLGIMAHGFALFLVSSLLWGAVGFAMREPSGVLSGDLHGDQPDRPLALGQRLSSCIQREWNHA